MSVDGYFLAGDPGTHNALVMLGLVCLVVLAFMARYREPACDRCPHCQEERKRKTEEGLCRIEHKTGDAPCFKNHPGKW